MITTFLPLGGEEQFWPAKTIFAGTVFFHGKNVFFHEKKTFFSTEWQKLANTPMSHLTLSSCPNP